MFYSLSYRIWVVQFLFSEVCNSFAHCLNLVLVFKSGSLHFVTDLLVKHLHINKFCLHQSSWWLCRLRCVTKFCLLSQDLPIILWVTFCTHSLLFLPAKAMQNNFRKFEELVFCDLWFPVSRFWIRVSDSGFWFPIPDSGLQFLGLPISEHWTAPCWEPSNAFQSC